MASPRVLGTTDRCAWVVQRLGPVAGAVLAGVLMAGLVLACSRNGGGEPLGRAAEPPSGVQLAERVFEGVAKGRQQAALPPVPRDPVLDERAQAGLRLLEAGVPAGVSALDHLDDATALPVGLSYLVDFVKDTPEMEEVGRRTNKKGGYSVSEARLAADPAIDGIGLAGGGPWAVLVLRSRLLGPGDTPALQRALEAALEEDRSGLQRDAALSTLAAEAVANGDVSSQDVEGFGRAGGVPVHLEYTERDNFRPMAYLDGRLDREGPETLHEPWLSRVGVATKITVGGTVVYVVLATGEADRAALVSQIAGAESKATDLVNLERADLRLPSLRRDARLATAARLSLADAIKRNCFTADDRCSPAIPDDAELYYEQRTTWFSAEDPYAWDLDAEDGAETYRRFGAAATIGPDGLVWSVLLLAA